MTNNVATDITAALKHAGVENFFLLTGGDQPLWIALRDAGIRMVVARSEASAVYMADGYARASGRVAPAYGQAGPGAANVAAALADAVWAQSPVFALTGATATQALHMNEYQDLDQHVIFQPVTKWNGAVAAPEMTGSLVSQALHIAATPTCGPTHLDVPKNFFALPGDPQTANRLERSYSNAASKVRALGTEVATALDLLKRAERPVLFVGEGVRLAGAWAELALLSDLAGIPIVATAGGKPAILTSHPNFCGIVGRYSSVSANKLVAEADCALALGTRLGGLATNGYTLPSRKATVIQIDHDPASLINTYAPRLGVRADIKIFLTDLLDLVKQQNLRTSSAWLDRCRRDTDKWTANHREQLAASGGNTALSPLSVLDELSRYGSEITLVADTGYMAAWTGVLFPTLRYDAFFRAVGSLGWALPASLGVQIARSEKVVCITGDGGAGYHLADVETAVRYRLPVVIIVMNNSALAFEYHEKYRWKGNVVAEANDFGRVDFAAAGIALGARGARATNREEFVAAMAVAMKASNPFVIDVVIDKEAFPPVTNFDAVMERKL
ncbi:MULTISPECIES: thiamine pyrophosphate-binding protein [Bradyrhizobium]|nr:MULTISPECIES: thiamine pyrophosphate-binding protein [Bradyrhizobium]MCG2643275.1 thiamine pyrophosphate-binding protein [Bradyrhizobium zhengyangense]MDN5002767.1 thiamine pyrophosphate-binding protein [Bradyrhizobium sp. WYCCWR 12677]MDT4736696.1 thiamine pyrophosphate-binding protein [Bradyrhizobium sp. WYCCWR 12699]GGI25899.1 acetolactate synthase, large subunit, biosynthetic type [Bradyrhizobium guangdongense]